MSWEMALDYIRALIWPSVVLILGFTFRRQLRTLFGRVESVETPLGSVAFEKQAEAVAQEAAEIENEIASEVAAAENSTTRNEESDSRNPEERDEEPSYTTNERPRQEDRFGEIYDQVHFDTTSAVLSAWREVERALRRAARENGITRITPRQASAHGLLSRELGRSVEDLHQLRNRVVHEGDITLTASGAKSYVTAAQRIVDALSLASSPALQAQQYEREAIHALNKAGLHMTRGLIDHAGADVYGRTLSGQTIAAEILFRKNQPLSMRDIEKIKESLKDRVTSVLVVTNTPLSREVQQFNATGRESRPGMEVVQWRDDEDNDLLVRAVARMGI
ncbi:hypothetical protein [Streptomyces sp. NPDC001743]|uniref:hypothetical protein n=1 Tax=Streptomyces sp. NPDC001743 TaxID=3154397 RepID=UPI003320055D